MSKLRLMISNIIVFLYIIEMIMISLIAISIIMSNAVILNILSNMLIFVSGAILLLVIVIICI